MTPQRFLFVLWEGGGTIPPELAIAARLVARGNEVRVLGDPSLGPEAIAAGASFVPYRRAPHRSTRTPESEIIRDWGATTPLGAFARARDRHAFGPAALFAKEVLEAQADHASDAVVVDGMLFGGLVGAEASGKPWAALIPMTSFLPAPGRPPPALGLRPARGPLGGLRDRLLLALGDRVLWGPCLPLLNRARADVGLGAVAHPLDQVRRADRVLVLTSPTFDFHAPRREGNVEYTGPELADPSWAVGAAPARGERPLVLVSLSTTYQRHERLLERIARALAPVCAQVVVTLGPAIDPSRLAVPPTVALVPNASHANLLRDARLVVTHGGHGTVIRALAAGVPLLVLPLGRDQADNAIRVVQIGAGVRLSAWSGAAHIRRVAIRALADEGMRAAAQGMARTIAAERQGDPAIEALEALGRRETGV
jgi:UDP:flavonoid glycosyltransferase YjiC (YdhE family)